MGVQGGGQYGLQEDKRDLSCQAQPRFWQSQAAWSATQTYTHMISRSTAATATARTPIFFGFQQIERNPSLRGQQQHWDLKVLSSRNCTRTMSLRLGMASGRTLGSRSGNP